MLLCTGACQFLVVKPETPSSSVIDVGKIEVLWLDLKNLCEDTVRLCWSCKQMFVRVRVLFHSAGARRDDKSRFHVGKEGAAGDAGCTAVLEPGVCFARLQLAARKSAPAFAPHAVSEVTWGFTGRVWFSSSRSKC